MQHESAHQNKAEKHETPDAQREGVSEAAIEQAATLFETHTQQSLTHYEHTKQEHPPAPEAIGIHDPKKFFDTIDRFERRARRVMRKLRAQTGMGSLRDMREFKEPIAHGEEFDVNEGLALIRYADTADRPQQLADFKERHAYQLEGIATIQEELLTKLRRHKDTPLSELEAWLNESGKRYGLTEVQRSLGRSVLTKYAERQEHLTALRTKNPDDTHLYAELFGSLPNGKVEIVDGPGTFYVRCHNEDDYQHLFYSRFKYKGELTEEQKQYAAKSGGASIATALDPRVEGSIILENSVYLYGPNNQYRSDGERIRRSESIRIHEEQHALKRFFGEALYRTSMLDDLLDSDNPEDDARILTRYAEHRREVIAEDRARDEILAYFKDGTNPSAIRAMLLDKAGLYNYLKDKERDVLVGSVKVVSNIDAEDLETITTLSQSVITKVFGPDYERLIGVACVIPAWLEHFGMTPEQVVGILVHEPLGRWEKVAKRLLGKNYARQRADT